MDWGALRKHARDLQHPRLVNLAVIEPLTTIKHNQKSRKEVLPRFELGLLDSESRVLTVTPQDRTHPNNVFKIRPNSKNIILRKCLCDAGNEHKSGFGQRVRHQPISLRHRWQFLRPLLSCQNYKRIITKTIKPHPCVNPFLPPATMVKSAKKTSTFVGGCSSNGRAPA